MDNDRINRLIAPYRTKPLECDGMTRVLLFVLQQAQVECVAMSGRISGNGRSIAPHFWIKLLTSKQYVDLRARMWLGEHPLVPHGVFDPHDYPAVQYLGMEINMRVDERLFLMLIA